MVLWTLAVCVLLHVLQLACVLYLLSVFEFCSVVLSETLTLYCWIFISIVVLVRIDSQWRNR